MKYIKSWLCIVAAGCLALGPCLSARSSNNTRPEEERLQNAGKVTQEILNVPDDIPQDLLNRARCVIVMPSVLKAAFVVGASYGRGTMVCRTGEDFTGPWGAPVKLGADASIAAGPKGRSAAADTDTYMRAEILSYSRARGVFAGVSLEGSTLRPDDRANRKLYGNPSARAANIVLDSDVTAPPAAYDLIAALQNSSPELKR